MYSHCEAGGTGFLAVPAAGAVVHGPLERRVGSRRCPERELYFGFVFMSWVRWVAGTTFGNLLLSPEPLCRRVGIL